MGGLARTASPEVMGGTVVIGSLNYCGTLRCRVSGHEEIKTIPGFCGGSVKGQYRLRCKGNLNPVNLRLSVDRSGQWNCYA